MNLAKDDWLLLKNGQVAVVSNRGLFASMVWVYRPAEGSAHSYAIPVVNIQSLIPPPTEGVTHGFGIDTQAKCGYSSPLRAPKLAHDSFVGCQRCKALAAEAQTDVLRRDDTVLLARILRETGRSAKSIMREILSSTGRRVTEAQIEEWCKIQRIKA